MDTIYSSPWSLLASAFLAAIVYGIFYYREKHSYWKRKGVDGPMALPVLGTTWTIFTKPLHQASHDNVRKYGKIYGIYENTKPFLVVSDTDIIRHVLVKDFHIFTNRLDRTQAFGGEQLVSKFLSSMADDDWKRVRTIMTPTFTSGKMRRMYAAMADTADESIAALDKTIGADIDLKSFAGKYTIDVIARCCFATRPRSHDNPTNKFLKSAHAIFQFKIPALLALFVLPTRLVQWLKIEMLPRESMDYFRDAIVHLIKERKEKDIVVNDMLQLLIEAQAEQKDNDKDRDVEQQQDHEAHHGVGDRDDTANMASLFDRKSLKKKTMDESEIIANSILFLGAGYETTSTLLSLCMYYLALNADVQQQLHQELVALGELDYEKVVACEYLDACIQETLRMNPPAAIVGRECSAEYRIPGTDITIPPGTDVQIPVYAIHHDADNYPRPEVFDPSRFLPAQRHLLKPYTYLPFGAGPRNCIGMRFALLEAKLLVAKLVLNFRFVKTDNTDVPPRWKTIGLSAFEPLLIGAERR